MICVQGGIKNQLCRADGNAGWAETAGGSIYYARPLTNTRRDTELSPGLNQGVGISIILLVRWVLNRIMFHLLIDLVLLVLSSVFDPFMLHGICSRQEERSGLLIESSKVGGELQRKGEKH